LVPNAIPPKQFVPPDGFVATSSTTQTHSNPADSILSNLKGKGLWHITAPVSVSLESIQQFTLDAIATGEKILSVGGSDYRLRTEVIHADNRRRLLLLDRKTKSYKATPEMISQTLHVQQLVAPPGPFEQSEEQHELAVAAATAMPYAQPEGMKMRYRPFGTEDAPPETIGASSGEGSDQGRPRFRLPRGFEPTKLLEAASKKSRKSKESHVKSSRKKSKKSHIAQEHIPSDQPNGDSEAVEQASGSNGEEAVVDEGEMEREKKKKKGKVDAADEGMKTADHQEGGGKGKKKSQKSNEQGDTEPQSPKKTQRKKNDKKKGSA
jgi:hypothetical protein